MASRRFGQTPSFADSSQWTPQHCFHDHLNFLCVDLYPSYLRHVGVRRVLYNSWWRSKKMSLTGTSTLLEFPVWGTEFGKVFLHQSGHLRVTVRSLTPKGIPFQESPSFQLAVGLAVHSFAGISSLSHWKPPQAWGVLWTLGPQAVSTLVDTACF